MDDRRSGHGEDYEPVHLGRAGIEVVVWDKYKKKRRGTIVVSVGGIRWYPRSAKKYTRFTSNQLGTRWTRLVTVAFATVET